MQGFGQHPLVLISSCIFDDSANIYRGLFRNVDPELQEPCIYVSYYGARDGTPGKPRDGSMAAGDDLGFRCGGQRYDFYGEAINVEPPKLVYSR